MNTNPKYSKFPVFESHNYGNIDVITVYAKNDNLKNLAKLKEFLLNVEKSGQKKIIIDLSLCGFLNFTVWCTLMNLLIEINKEKRFLKLVCDFLHHSSIISNTRAHKVFEIYYDLNEAINRYS
jgi:hypothetical protein